MTRQLAPGITFLTADKGQYPVKASAGQQASLAYTMDKEALPFIPDRVTGYTEAQPKAQQLGTCWCDR